MLTDKIIQLINQNQSINVSSRYSHVTTETVLQRLRELEFSETAGSSAKVKKTSREGYQTHMIRLSSPDFTTASFEARGIRPEIIIVNSHDALSSFKMYFGLYRFACANGLVLGDTFKSVKIRHVGDIMPKIEAALNDLVQTAPEVMETVERWSGIQLTEVQAAALAKAAVKLVTPEQVKLVDLERTLSRRRYEDRGQDLFTVFNVIQEKILNGGVQYVTVNELGETRRNTTRKVKSVKRQVELNRRLWDLAEEVSHV